MGAMIDEFAKALASAASRRSALAGLLAGVTELLPWTAAAKNKNKNKNKKRKRRQRRRQRRQEIQRYLEYCEFWCEQEFGPVQTEIDACSSAAASGHGPCYSANAKGPGYFCTKKTCGKHKYCCPVVEGGPVTEGTCCGKNAFCAFINGTFTGDLCVVEV
jgi:hypothetical protein